MDSIITVNYVAEKFGIYWKYTPPNLWSMDAAVSHQVILFQATVQSYVIEYTGQQQKLPTKDNAAQPTLDNVLEKGILIDENLWFDWLQDDVFLKHQR